MGFLYLFFLFFWGGWGFFQRLAKNRKWNESEQSLLLHCMLTGNAVERSPKLEVQKLQAKMTVIADEHALTHTFLREYRCQDGVVGGFQKTSGGEFGKFESVQTCNHCQAKCLVLKSKNKSQPGKCRVKTAALTAPAQLLKLAYAKSFAVTAPT